MRLNGLKNIVTSYMNYKIFISIAANIHRSRRCKCTPCERHARKITQLLSIGPELNDTTFGTRKDRPARFEFHGLSFQHKIRLRVAWDVVRNIPLWHPNAFDA